MPDYELLELVLFRALRHKDVKPLARSLFERCHHPSAVKRSQLRGFDKHVLKFF